MALVSLPAWADGVVSDGNEYVEKVKPVLGQRCYACHGALQQKAGLRLDTVEAMRVGGKSGPAIRVGDPEGSLIWQRASTEDSDERMPPEHEGERLDPAQLALLRRWITEGAIAPPNETPEPSPRDHWAFRKPVRPPLPPLPTTLREPSPIDAFLERERVAAGVVAQAEASRLTLMRRLYLDLIGLSPSREEIAALEADKTPDWYERLVTRLLADPRHGERWARHWMDIWRYSDAYGLGDQLRNSQRHVWQWRDWIVESLNADVPYDEMVRLMLAVDETHPDDLGRMRASGYLARQYFLFNRNQWMDEVVEHTGKAFLGLTLNCAKCHDHKYDPIPQLDYYRFRAFFEPYHVRLDVVPGTADLSVAGLPRAYDREPEAPTFRFVRGQESQPDRTRPVPPGVPELLTFAPLEIRPVPLPPTASDPDRRAWVSAAHEMEARQRLDVARLELARVATARGLPIPLAAPSDDAMPENEPAREVFIAALRRGAAEAELRGIRHRAAAFRARWEECADATERHRDAVRAERTAAVARARLTRALAEVRFASAKDGEREAANKALAEARKALEDARAAEGVAITGKEPLPPLPGSAWTPTRFADSTKDDPSRPFPAVSSGRRTALAGWISDSRNPLTARVAVNHVWNRHFGLPLAPGLFDFGRKTPKPIHAELLDWLAVEFMESGWSFKHLHRCMVLSAAYRMGSSSVNEAASSARDPDNRYWWRRPSIRLEAQMIRDTLLAHAGKLDTTAGGPPVPPGEQDTSRRRSFYFQHSNNDRNPFLAVFDDALVKECYRREQSIVPQQALALLNSRLVNEAAPAIARRLAASCATRESHAESADEIFIRDAFVTLLGFRPGAAELDSCRHALESWRAQANDEPGEDRSAERARVQLVWTLLNHHDFVNVR